MFEIGEKYENDIGWPTRQDRINQAEIDVFTLMSKNWSISDIKIAEEIVRSSTTIY